jgi:hypothetical protein
MSTKSNGLPLDNRLIHLIKFAFRLVVAGAPRDAQRPISDMITLDQMEIKGPACPHC